MSYFSRFTGSRSIGWLVVIGTTAIVVVSILYISPVYRAVGSTPVSWVYNVSVVGFALLDAILAFLLWRASEKGEVQRMIWASMAIGFLLWAAGEILWAVYELILEEDTPYPSIADVAWVCGYIPFFVAFYRRYHSLGVTPTRSQGIMSLGLAALLTIPVIIWVIIPIVTSGEEVGLIEQILNVLYPLGDLMLGLVVLLSMFALTGGVLARPWLFIAAGFVVVSVADLLFAYGTWNETYLIGSDTGVNPITFLTDVLYYSSYIIIAYGLMHMMRLQRVT